MVELRMKAMASTYGSPNSNWARTIDKGATEWALSGIEREDSGPTFILSGLSSDGRGFGEALVRQLV